GFGADKIPPADNRARPRRCFHRKRTPARIHLAESFQSIAPSPAASPPSEKQVGVSTSRRRSHAEEFQETRFPDSPGKVARRQAPRTTRGFRGRRFPIPAARKRVTDVVVRR